MNHVETDVVEFNTPYGPAYVVYNTPPPGDSRKMSVAQTLVKCPDHIVWDSDGKWYPSPEVCDYVIPRARSICELLGVPAFEWLDKVRRSELWAIERDFVKGEPVSVMMDFYHEKDYDGRYSQGTYTLNW